MKSVILKFDEVSGLNDAHFLEKYIYYCISLSTFHLLTEQWWHYIRAGWFLPVYFRLHVDLQPVLSHSKGLQTLSSIWDLEDST